jgi:hypothetical protein
MFDMEVITGFSDEGSGHSGSSQGSNHGSAGSFVAYTHQKCGSIFTLANTGEKQFICLRSKSCCRQDHAVSLKGENFGTLYMVTKNPNNYYDGILSTEIGPEEYAANLVVAGKSNQEALRVSGQRPPGQSGLQAAFNSPMTQIIDGRPTPGLAFANTPSTATTSDEVFETSPLQPEPEHIRSARELLHRHEQEQEMARVLALQAQRELNLARQRYEEDQIARRQPDPRENSARKSGRKKTTGEDRRRNKGSRKTKKGKSKKKHYRHSSSSSSLSSSSSDSEDTDSGEEKSNSSLKPKVKWYVMVCPDGRRYINTSKELSLGCHCPGCMKSTFKDHHKAWTFHDHWEATFRAAAASGASTPAPVISPPIVPVVPSTDNLASGNKVRNPGEPPIILRSGKDKLTDGEVYGINLEVSERELTEKLAPPGVTSQMAREISECLIDAVALPGKTGPTTEGDDAVTTMSLSLEAFSRMSRGDGSTGDTLKKDVKWAHSNRNALSKVKTEDDLRQMLHDVQSIRDGSLLHLISSQQTILLQRMGSHDTRRLVQQWVHHNHIGQSLGPLPCPSQPPP